MYWIRGRDMPERGDSGPVPHLTLFPLHKNQCEKATYIPVLNNQIIILFLFQFQCLTLLVALLLKWETSTANFDDIVDLSSAMHCARSWQTSPNLLSAGSYPTAAGSLTFFTQKEFLTPKLFPGAFQYGNCLKERKQQEQLKEQHCIWSQSMS